MIGCRAGGGCGGVMVVVVVLVTAAVSVTVVVWMVQRRRRGMITGYFGSRLTFVIDIVRMRMMVHGTEYILTHSHAPTATATCSSTGVFFRRES